MPSTLRVSLKLLQRRPVGHWTPSYLWHRGRVELWRRRHPEAPSLTASAVDLLEQLLDEEDVGAEWGSGASTLWFAKRTKYLASFETNPAYFEQVRGELSRQGLDNVDYECIAFEDTEDDAEMELSAWVRTATAFEDSSLDYALVDSSPRGCLAKAMAPKIRDGGVLILDDANWYIPPPPGLRPTAPGSVMLPLGSPGSRAPWSRAWPRFLELTSSWRRIWTSDGVQTTLVFIKCRAR